jgi:hypothetical protein
MSNIPNSEVPGTYVAVPILRNSRQVTDFDREVFRKNPHWKSFCRRAFSFEFPPGEFEEMSHVGTVYCFVLQGESRRRRKAVLVVLNEFKPDLNADLTAAEKQLTANYWRN